MLNAIAYSHQNDVSKMKRINLHFSEITMILNGQTPSYACKNYRKTHSYSD